MKKSPDWSSKELAILHKVWGVLSRSDVVKALPNRTYQSIERKANRQGLTRERLDGVEWGDEEISILIDGYYNGKPPKVIMKSLPGRSVNAIACKAGKLGLTNHKFERPIFTGQVVKENLTTKGKPLKFAIVSDTHFGSRYAQITYLHQFYKRAAEEGVDCFIHAGDLSEGNGHHYAGQLFEMHITGADNLKDFIVANYPKQQNIPTYFVAGWHDLDLWKYEGFNLPKAVQQERSDIHYLGDASVTLLLNNKKFEIMHPDGGSMYALSYRIQKVVESFSSENKPHVLIMGHYHKAEYIPLLRNVYGFQAGCFQAQTTFAKRKNLQWHYGGWIVEMGLFGDSICNVKAEFIPFYKPIVDDYKNFE